MITLFLVSAAAADDCPSETGRGSFFIERGPHSRTEVFSGDGAVVRTILRNRERTLLETTLHEGLFELECLDRGRRYTLKPRANLTDLFPLKQKINIAFDIQYADGRRATSRVKLAVIGSD